MFLLGIENHTQLNTHPLKGGVFENLAVIELLKQRFNQGKQSDIFFYRENGGREADIVKTNGMKLDLVEVTASQTWNKSFISNLEYLKRLLGERIGKSIVVYDGESLAPDVVNISQLTKAL